MSHPQKVTLEKYSLKPKICYMDGTTLATFYIFNLTAIHLELKHCNHQGCTK